MVEEVVRYLCGCGAEYDNREEAEECENIRNLDELPIKSVLLGDGKAKRYYILLKRTGIEPRTHHNIYLAASLTRADSESALFWGETMEIVVSPNLDVKEKNEESSSKTRILEKSEVEKLCEQSKCFEIAFG